jgi:hypothetical protein
MTTQFQIDIDSLTFSITVLHYSAPVPGEHTSWASDHDYYGYDAEVDWKCTGVTETDEDGNMTDAHVILDSYEEAITEKILALIEEMRDDAGQDHDYDYPEPDNYPDWY